MFEKIQKLYPELTIYNLTALGGTILIQNDSDGKGDYIAAWEHPVYPEPTPEQLA